MPISNPATFFALLSTIIVISIPTGISINTFRIFSTGIPNLAINPVLSSPTPIISFLDQNNSNWQILSPDSLSKTVEIKIKAK